MFKFAKIVTELGRVVLYEGEPIPEIKDNFGKVSETTALNLLGAKGYDIYHTSETTRRSPHGEYTHTTFRLKAKI